MSGAAGGVDGPALPATLQLDLAFGEPAAESAFRAQFAPSDRRTALLSAAVRCAAWGILALRLGVAGDRQGAGLAALGAASDGAYLAVHATRPQLSLPPPATAAYNLMEAVMHTVVALRLWSEPDGLGGRACFRSAARTAFAAGCAWMVGCLLFPLPFRWAYLQQLILALLALQRTPAVCASPVLYRGCGLEGGACAAVHTACVLATLVLNGAAIYRQELAARLAWAAPRAREQLRRQHAAQPFAYWLHFALPGTCTLLAYGLPPWRSPPGTSGA